TTTDEKGGVTVQTIVLTFGPDSDKEAVYTVEASKPINEYTNGNVLATVADADGAITNAEVTSGSIPAGVIMNADGSFEVSDASALVAGDYPMEITTTDEKGGVTVQTIVLTFGADSDKEAVYTVITAKPINEYFNGDILATVADADGAITNAEITNGSIPAGVIMNANGSFEVSDASALIAGDYPIEITTTDEKGGVTVQTIVLTFGPDSDKEAVYTVETDKPINEYSNGNVLATVADADGAITNAEVTNGSLPAGVTLNSDGSIQVSNKDLLEAGDHSFEITTTDEKGGVTVQTIVLTFGADSDKEAVYTVEAGKPINEYDNGNVLATVADADGAITNAEVTSGSLPSGVIMNADGSFEVSDASALVAGDYPIEITTTDEKGGVTVQTIVLTFGPDSDKEAVYTVETSKPINEYSNGNILATVADADGAITKAEVTSGNLPAGVTINSDGSIQVSNKDLLEAGDHSFEITTTDEKGGVTVQTIVLTFGADSDKEAVYTVETGKPINEYSNGNILATVTDADGAITNAEVTSGSLPAGVTLNSDGSIQVSNKDLLKAGDHSFEITTTDEKGGVTVHTIILTFGADSDKEAVYTMETAKPINEYSNGNVLATVTDADGTITNAEVTSGSIPSGVIMTANGSFKVSDASALVAGDYPIEITTTDEKGGVTVQTIILTFGADSDKEAVYTVETGKPINEYSNGNILAIVTDADGAITNAEVTNGSLPSGVTLNSDGSIQVSNKDLLEAGDHSFEITTTDEKGGVTVQTIILTFGADSDKEAVYTVEASKPINEYSNGNVLATVADADGTINNAEVTSGSIPSGVIMNADGSFEVSDASALVAGDHPMEITTTDEKGGVTVQTIVLTFGADSDKEAIYTVEASKPINEYSNGNILATVADTDGAITKADVTSGSIPSGVIMNADGSFEVSDASALVAGDYSIEITSTDEKGGVTVQTIVLTFGADSDEEAVYTIEAGKPINEYTNGDILATVADADGAIIKAEITNGSLPAGVTLNSDGSIQVSNKDLLEASAHSFEITTSDEKGGVTVNTIILTFGADSDKEAVYTVEASKPINEYANGNVLATVADADGAITNAEVTSGNLPAGVTLNSDGSIQVSNKDLLEAGDHSFEITTTDEKGGVTVQTIVLTFEADSDKESVYTVEASKPINEYSNGNILATVADADGAITNAEITNGSLPSGVIMNADGSFEVSDASALVTGDYSIEITTTDENGGVTVQTIVLSFMGSSDLDNDGLLNDEEIIIGTDPLNPDSDGDGLTDGEEVLGEDDNFTELQPDGVSDPLDICDPLQTAPGCDPDNDGLTNDQEAAAGTDPLDADTDNDGLYDGEEVTGVDNPATETVAIGESDPLNRCDPNPVSSDCLENGPEISQKLSPNGDGINDYFSIKGLDQYEENTLKIYNRWGVLLYEASNYGQNDKLFRGISEGRLTIRKGEELPAGTYFYVLRFKDGTWKSKSGYLYLTR
ncbi:gliding motility-associated C-terminal domain-containing protein, partial [Christiangramia aquimixticola]|uniref:T9SS type B sorting domain-containing protein n=1 Tax=Christiangramia aquimixticola TaxID=1697558 RepID=UPI003AA92791